MRLKQYRVLAIGLTALSVSACSYKKFAEQEQAIKEEWGQVQTELQRRNDLIPALIEAVRGYVPDNEPIYQAVNAGRQRLRAARTALEAINAANEQSMALERLMVIVESHPELQANESFRRQMSDLATAQTGIAIERMRYNAQVQQYNLSRGRFPGMLTAQLFFHSYPLFEVPPPSRDGSRAEFGRPSER